jgi:hypothetical protein
VKNDTLAVSDFGEVIYLLCSDAELLNARRVAPNRVAFVFSGKGNCEGLIANMMFSDSVSLSRCLHEIRKARNIIHSTP